MTQPNAPVPDYCELCRKDAAEVCMHNVREHVVGIDREVPLCDGGTHQYVNFDNAATTPPLSSVVNCCTHFFDWYSSVHRGSGFKSLLSTHVYHQCRQVVADFVGADLQDHHTLIFTQNATHALNKLAMRLNLRPGEAVITTLMEHHSNLLPWRKVAHNVEVVGIKGYMVDLDALAAAIQKHAGRLRLVTVTAASNVTGAMPPIRQIARMAHEAGALMAIDATQLVPHRRLDMGAADDPERIDFAAFSAHKMYAPFGSGALIGPKDVFKDGSPDIVGGGTIQGVTLNEVIWAEPPEKDEAGTPNMPGALALASAIQTLESIGMDEVAAHERTLTAHLLRKLKAIDGLTLYGPTDADLAEDRVSAVTFNLAGIDHARVAAALGFEWGIGVRNGCFCAQPYVRSLLDVTDDEMKTILERLAQGDHVTIPGMVRASLGIYNTLDEIDYFAEAVRAIATDGPGTAYHIDPEFGDYIPDVCDIRLDDYAPLAKTPARG